MKIEQVQKLSDEKLRVMVAELDGWEGRLVDVSGSKKPKLLWFNIEKGFGNRECPSDYTRDEMAMFVAQQRLFEKPDGYACRYVALLSKIANKGWMHAVDAVCFANARQRAEAFVVVMTEKQE